MQTKQQVLVQAMEEFLGSCSGIQALKFYQSFSLYSLASQGKSTLQSTEENLLRNFKSPPQPLHYLDSDVILSISWYLHISVSIRTCAEPS